MTTTFQYKALNANGEVLQGTLEAEHEQAVVSHLQQQGCYPVKIGPVNTSTGQSPAFRQWLTFKPRQKDQLTRKQLLSLTQDISTLFNAGLDIEHCLRNLLSSRKDPGLNKLLTAIYQDLQDGHPLSKALARHADNFDHFYLAVIRAGEAGGNLGDAFSRLATHLEKVSALRNSIISSLLYPAILCIISLLSLVFLLSFVIPRFIPMFEGAEASLPLLSSIVFSFSAFFQSYWWLLLPGIILLFLAGRQALKYYASTAQYHAFILKLPLMGNLIRHQIVAAFTRTMSTLLDNGLPLVEALNLSKGALTQAQFRNEIDQAMEQVQAGRKLSTIFADSHFMTELALDLIKVGEETGNLPAMFGKAAGIYEEETEQQLKRLLVFLEPILILGLGVLIALIILSVLLAMLSLNDLII